jgi:glutamate synthase domain-containing protein 1
MHAAQDALGLTKVLWRRCMRAGEINTLQGNLNWVASREHSLTNPVWAGREAELLPLCNAAESDSANLDHVAELLMATGVDATEALMILVPEAYRNHPDLQRDYPEARARTSTPAPFLFFYTPESAVGEAGRPSHS